MSLFILVVLGYFMMTPVEISIDVVLVLLSLISN